MAGRCLGSDPRIRLDHCASERSEVQLDACRRAPLPQPLLTAAARLVAPPSRSNRRRQAKSCFDAALSAISLQATYSQGEGVAPRPPPDPNWEVMIEGSAKHADGSRQHGRLTQSRSTFIAIPARWVSPVYQHARRPSIHMLIEEGTKRASTDPDLYRAFPAGTVCPSGLASTCRRYVLPRCVHWATLRLG